MPWSAPPDALLGLDEKLSYLDKEMRQWRGRAPELRESAAQLLDQFEGKARSARLSVDGWICARMALVPKSCAVGVRKMQLLGQPRRMPSMAGYGLEITGYITKE